MLLILQLRKLPAFYLRVMAEQEQLRLDLRILLHIAMARHSLLPLHLLQERFRRFLPSLRAN